MKKTSDNNKKQEKLSSIQIKDLKKWIGESSDRQIALKCQALIAIENNNSISSVCSVFGINRETLRQWQKKVNNVGIIGLSNKPGKGRKMKISQQIIDDLKIQLVKNPADIGYQQEQWDGKLVRQYIFDFHQQSIALRTAQNYLKSFRRD